MNPEPGRASFNFGASSGAHAFSDMSKVLLVDDQSEFLAVHADLLRCSGFAVTTADNGADALQKLGEGGYGLLITDVIMPFSDGISLILEARRQHPEVRIVAMSGGGFLSPENHLRVAKRVGADLTLAKPFSVEELLEAVNQLLVPA